VTARLANAAKSAMDRDPPGRSSNKIAEAIKGISMNISDIRQFFFLFDLEPNGQQQQDGTSHHAQQVIFNIAVL
jgi:hypothetical protein